MLVAVLAKVEAHGMDEHHMVLGKCLVAGMGLWQVGHKGPCWVEHMGLCLMHHMGLCCMHHMGLCCMGHSQVGAHHGVHTGQLGADGRPCESVQALSKDPWHTNLVNLALLNRADLSLALLLERNLQPPCKCLYANCMLQSVACPDIQLTQMSSNTFNTLAET